MFRMHLLFLILILSITYSIAQTPDTIWTKTYGDSSYDSGSSIIQTNENNFIISGSIGTQLSGNSHTSDIWLFGIDEVGTELWSHNYGGMGGGDIVEASNNEYFVAADTYNQGENMQLLKINQIGDTIWTRIYFLSGQEYAPDIARTLDGGLVLLEFSYGFPKGALLIKVDESGDTLWTRFFPDEFYSLFPSSPIIDGDGKILFLISKLDTTFLYKTDSFGNLLSINEVCTAPYSATKFMITEGGNYLMLGTYQPTYDSSTIWISCVDYNLNTIWSQMYPSSVANSSPTNFIKSNSEGYLIVGSEGRWPNNDGIVLKINDTGELIWKKSYGGVLSEEFRDILMLGNNQFFIVGTTESFGAGENDAWVLKFTADTATSAVKNDDNSKLPQGYILNQNYPNPFNPNTKISWQALVGSWQTLMIYGVLGNVVETIVDEYRPAGSYEIEWDASSYPSGVYFYQLRTENYTETKKMILLK